MSRVAKVSSIGAFQPALFDLINKAETVDDLKKVMGMFVQGMDGSVRVKREGTNEELSGSLVVGGGGTIIFSMPEEKITHKYKAENPAPETKSESQFVESEA